MIKIFGQLLVLILCASCVSAFSPRTAHLPQGICTRDINEWGHAGNCSCESNLQYDPRSGLCIDAQTTESITIQGVVTADAMAIGGETTGFVIESKEGRSYELILRISDQKKIRKLSGMWFEVEGGPLVIHSVELKKRNSIIVERIRVLE